MLSESAISALNQTLSTGIPLDAIPGVYPELIERFKVCMKVTELMEQDPTLDIRATLKYSFHRSPQQIVADREAIDIIIGHLHKSSRARAEFIVRKTAERMIRIGEQSGDWKPMEAGAKRLTELEHLNQPEDHSMDVQKTAMLPVVLVPIEKKNKNSHSLSEEAIRKIMGEYETDEDELQKIIRKRAREMAMGVMTADESEAHELQEPFPYDHNDTFHDEQLENV